MKKFLNAFLSFGLATTIEKILGFVIVPIYTNQFSILEYGTIDLLATVVNISLIFGLLQLETAFQRFYYEYSGAGKKSFISTIFFLVILLSLLITVILFLFSKTISYWLFESDINAHLVRLAAVQIPLQNIVMLGLLLLRFEQQNFKFLIVILAKVFAMLGSVYFFVIYLRSGLPGVFSAQILANVGALGVVLFFCRSYLNTKFSKVNSRILFKYSLPQFPARLGSMCLGEMNRFFLLHFLSIQAIGVFSLSLKVASMIQLVNMAFLMAWAPVMFALFKQENNKQIFSQVFNLVCCVTFMIVCIISLFAKEVVELIVQKEDFRTAFRYVGGLALFYALYIVKEVVDIGPKYTHKTYYISYNFFFSVLLNLVALYFFIKYFELNGVVYAMVLTNLGLVLISWFTSNRLYYIPFNKTLFVVLLLPAMALCYYAMETDLHLWVRICILMIVLAFYLTIGYQYFRKIRTNQWLV